MKLAYPREYNLTYVISVITEFFNLLDKKRELSGFSAPLDVPCGLPSIISFVDENPYPDPKVTNIPVDLLDNSFNSSPQNIPSTAPPAVTPGRPDNSYIKIKRSQAFKIPRFCNSQRESCNMESIIEFHNLLFYPFSYFETLLESLKSELNPSGNNKYNKKRESVVLFPLYHTF